LSNEIDHIKKSTIISLIFIPRLHLDVSSRKA